METLPESSDSENEEQHEKQRKEMMENEGMEENGKQGEKERKDMMENKGMEDKNGKQSEKENVFGNYKISHKQQWLNADEALAKLKLVQSCQQYSSVETLPESSDSENEQQRSVSQTMDPLPTFPRQSAQGYT